MGKKGAMSAFVLLVGIAVGGAAEAQVTGQAHEYVVPNHGKLTLAFPGNLKGFSKPVSEPASVLLRFRPQTGDAFYVQVTSVWLDATKIATSTPEHLKATVAKTAQEPLRHSVEKDATLKELRGAETRGFYYSLTDRAPGPGEYKYLSQGSFLTGEMMTIFTILHREPVCPEKETVLQMFAQAKYVK